MGKRDERVDAYIAKSADFARPILVHLRGLVHAACPEAEETLKWGMPHFTYHGLLCGMAAFQRHCTFGFWKGRLIVDSRGLQAEAAMGQFGRITRIADLPSRRVLTGYVKRAMKLNLAGVPGPGSARQRKPRKPLPVPADLRAALAKDRRARATFEGLSPSQRREYVEWIIEARRDETRARRLGQAIEWMAAGKPRNWRYAKRRT